MQSQLLDFEEAFNWMQASLHRTAVEKGFHQDWDNPLKVPTMLALVASEVSEALEAHRKGDDDHLSEELADIVIRVMDLAEALDLDLASVIVDKAKKNKDRPYKHGNKRY